MTNGSVSSYFVGIKGGLVMSIIAFSIVFIVIIGLMLIMIAMKHISAAVEGAGKGSGGGGKTAALVQPATQPQPAKAAAAGDDGELLAVISAAIAAVCGSAARVVSFGPIVKAPAVNGWKLAARMRGAESFQD